MRRVLTGRGLHRKGILAAAVVRGREKDGPHGQLEADSRPVMEKNDNHLTIGWREWVSLPDLAIRAIKAKVDTGARSSSLHAYDLEEFERHGASYVRFKVHPMQRSSQRVVEAEARILEYRSVRSSSGKATIRRLGMRWVSGCCWAGRPFGGDSWWTRGDRITAASPVGRHDVDSARRQIRQAP
jgi:hypothetical protein